MNTGVFRRAVAVMVGALALGSMTTAMAQAPQGGPPRGPGGGMGMMGAPADRPTTIERMGLAEASLNLTAAQKGEIDKIVDAYLAEQTKLREKYPVTQGAPPSQEYMTALRTSRSNLDNALGKVLNDQQRAAWQAAQAARRPAGPGGAPGGGGPGGARPPAGR